MSRVRVDAPQALAEYAMDHNLQDQRGFTWCRSFLEKLESNAEINSNIRVNIATIGQSKRILKELYGKGRKNIFQYGVQVPQTPEEAARLDTNNGNQKWNEAEEKELSTLFKNETFKEVTENDYLSKYKLIPLLIENTVKAYGEHKVIIVARDIEQDILNRVSLQDI